MDPNKPLRNLINHGTFDDITRWFDQHWNSVGAFYWSSGIQVLRIDLYSHFIKFFDGGVALVYDHFGLDLNGPKIRELLTEVLEYTGDLS